MSLVLNVEILGEFKKLTTATQGAQKQLSSLSGTASKISSSIGRAFATIGVGLSFAFIARELKEAGKAAVDDAKSQGILEKALRNVTGASDLQIDSVEKSITKMSLQSAVADDKLRPAFANLLRATGDITKSTGLMNLALDIAAGTGKDVESVSKAISRAVGPDGTTGALERLVPAIKGANDPLGELERLFGGTAEKAANLDPYARLKVAMDEISESIGVILIPVIEGLADWMVEILPLVQNFFAQLTDPTTVMGEKWAGMIAIMQDTGDEFNNLMDILSGGAGAQNMLMDWITSITAGLGQILFFLGRLAQGWQAFFAGDFGKVFDLSASYLKDYEAFVREQNQSLMGGIFTAPTGSTSGAAREGNITININRGNITAQEIADAINRDRKRTGSPSINSGAIRP
ncbi:hypothetical protein UFOVP332_12 [uncultured Caudovirales phage]|uniref:Uncharacterized protein n=1 Tax=uncultured Caudovirales phage TaxID=2100421 RepID=A0A6J5LZY4_9CAUD|nr:hypothetical protein UFOVP332_12 [uncultured Caudovirales phage]